MTSRAHDYQVSMMIIKKHRRKKGYVPNIDVVDQMLKWREISDFADSLPRNSEGFAIYQEAAIFVAKKMDEEFKELGFVVPQYVRPMMADSIEEMLVAKQRAKNRFYHLLLDDATRNNFRGFGGRKADFEPDLFRRPKVWPTGDD